MMYITGAVQATYMCIIQKIYKKKTGGRKVEDRPEGVQWKSNMKNGEEQKEGKKK